MSIKIIPFTGKHFTKFREELDNAGSFYDLMIEKKAMSIRDGNRHITIYNDIERYKEKYLTGEYESLRPMFETEMPYTFWSELYEALLKFEKTQI